MHRHIPLLLLLGCSSDVLVAHTTGTVALDSPLEFQFADNVDSSALDGLELVHDGVHETGKVTVEANVARFWPDHGWYAGATYQATIDGVDQQDNAAAPFSFQSHGAWRLLDGPVPGGCGASDSTPQVHTTLAGDVWIASLGAGGACLTQHTSAGWQPPTHLGPTPASGSTEQWPSLHLDEAGHGFAITMIGTTAQVLGLDGSSLGQIEGVYDFSGPPIGAISPGGHGLVAWVGTASLPSMRPLFARAFDDGALGAAETVAQGDLYALSSAANDGGVRALTWTTSDSAATHVFVAVRRGTGAWTKHEVSSFAPNSFQASRVVVADDGWVYVAWLANSGGTTAVFAYAELDAQHVVAATRIDAGAATQLRSDLALDARAGHVRVAWLEKPDDRQLGAVVTRTATAGVWAAEETSAGLDASVAPYLTFAMTIDALGNPVFTWKGGDLVPCAARRLGTTWNAMCGLPMPNYTGTAQSVAVNARGRGFVSGPDLDGIWVAAFD